MAMKSLARSRAQELLDISRARRLTHAEQDELRACLRDAGMPVRAHDPEPGAAEILFDWMAAAGFRFEIDDAGLAYIGPRRAFTPAIESAVNRHAATLKAAVAECDRLMARVAMAQ